jgi:DNA-binding MarR family transcriptional regulator
MKSSTSRTKAVGLDPNTWLIGSGRDFGAVAKRLGLPKDALKAVALIRSSAVIVSQLEAAHWARLGLSAASGWVLIELRLEGPLRPGELAASFLVSRGGMSQVIAHLVRKGLVEKRRDSTDRRAFAVSLTPRGRSLIDQQMPVLAEALSSIERSLGRPRLRALSETLGEFVESLRSLGD